ncbi:CoA transferase [Streptomyces sp. NPDC096311]|uniref:CoA transferase n=1 Tax=Streptomyces sp. NPDC096311 TaxID=3366083 RepID=UPI003827F904
MAAPGRQAESDDPQAPAGDDIATAETGRRDAGDGENDAMVEWARSGVVALTGHADGPPLVPPGRAAVRARALSERIAELTADSASRVRVDGPALLAERAAFTHRQRDGRTTVGGAGRLLPTADGWAAVTCARDDDPPLLGAMIGRELTGDIWGPVSEWVGAHSGQELAERAELFGLAARPVVRRPSATAIPSLAVFPRPRSMTDTLVVDFSALWAGPLCTHLLASAGARVVKVEIPGRPDGARRGDSDFYRLLHAGQQSVCLDPEEAGGRAALAALVTAADIVVEASRPRALARFGLDAREAVDAGTTWISITAAGRESDQVGFGDDVAAGAGLVAYEADGSPLFCGDALADPLTGLTAAVLALTAPENERGVLYDLAMSDVVAGALGPVFPEDTALPPSTVARRSGSGWEVETGRGTVTVAPPRHRTPVGEAPAMGEHTRSVLRGIGFPRR